MGVQVLAGVLLPSAVVFLLLLCNDKAVLGPWVNGKTLNIVTGVDHLGPGHPLGHPHRQCAVPCHHRCADRRRDGCRNGDRPCSSGSFLLIQARRHRDEVTVDDVLAETVDRDTWRMPPLARLERPKMSRQRKIGLMTLRGYLVVALALVVVKIVEVAIK